MIWCACLFPTQVTGVITRPNVNFNQRGPCCYTTCIFGLKSRLNWRITPPQVWPDWGSNQRPLDHDRTLNATEMLESTQPLVAHMSDMTSSMYIQYYHNQSYTARILFIVIQMTLCEFWEQAVAYSIVLQFFKHITGWIRHLFTCLFLLGTRQNSISHRLINSLASLLREIQICNLPYDNCIFLLSTWLSPFD